MEHNSGWETLEDDFVAIITHIVVTQPLSTIARPAIAILEKLVCANKNTEGETKPAIDCFGYPTIHRAMQREPDLIKTLVERLLSPEYLLSTASLSLLIAMLRHVTDEYRSELSNTFEKSNLKKNVLVRFLMFNLCCCSDDRYNLEVDEESPYGYIKAHDIRLSNCISSKYQQAT